ncbi:hypothetical protein M9458_020984, partial [Cirrhinus mrigala]
WDGISWTGDGECSAVVGRNCNYHTVLGRRPFGCNKLSGPLRFSGVVAARRRKSFSGVGAILPGTGG